MPGRRTKALLACLLLVAAVLPGPRVRKPAETVPPSDFVLYGDCREGREVHQRLCGLMVKSGAKFVINTGDLVRYDKWDEFREITRDLRSKMEYYSSIGDHDRTPPGAFLREMGLDSTRFDRRIGDLHFFFLESFSQFAPPEQITWLEETASRSDARHKIAVFHHPPFTMQERRVGQAVEVRKVIHDRLVRMKFCAAFCGHLHAYYTTLRDGIRYVVTGGGGAFPSPLDAHLAAPGDQYRTFFHYIGFTVGDTRISARVFDDYGDEDPSLSFTLCEHPRKE